MGEALRLENLHVHYETAAGPVKAVNGVSFILEEEQVFALVGESGAGKSTLALAIMGLLPDSAAGLQGKIIFDGVDLLRASPGYLRSLRGPQMALILQDARAALNPVQPVGAQLEEVFLAHSSLSRREAHRQALDILWEMGLPEPRRIMDNYPFQLSGGMCQRVLVSIGMALRPRLLIADEPTSGLDVTLQAEILQRLKALCQEFHSSVLLITHDLGIVAHMADRLAVMYAGTVVESGPVRTLFREPRHPYTRGLLQSLPRLDDSSKRLQPIQGSPPDMVNLPEQCPFLPRCPKAISRCRSDQRPPLEEMDPDHGVACYNPVISGSG